MDILSGSALQALAAGLFFFLIVMFLETCHFKITFNLLLSMFYLVFLVSLGAISILMLLIKRREMEKTASLFFLCPLVTAILGYILLW